MANSTLAPWAELAPGVDRLLTDDDLLRINDDNWAYELVEGRLVRMPPASGGDSWTAVSLATAITVFVQARNLGRVTGADGTYVLSQPGEPITSLVPDVAFVREGRYPSPDSPDFRRAWHVAPDLAVEVVSPNQYRPEMAEKARLYLEAGVRLLWLVWPTYRQVDVWRAGADRPVATLNTGDVLDGLDVLPGFTYPVRRLFS
jgi:Uma2 family endonuclease